ncbi:hypothetical protein QR680_004159 [Steinernema hermaphroditum]|uniref:Lipase_GDSL domain-containing protein n=1 Tax=Steinernema hermaphroditum TaxID=289476 RepID=A0AA39HQ19_9BILA|nr:hypothetical protein QR680_004159 [Steinernema hermaphroditum]
MHHPSFHVALFAVSLLALEAAVSVVRTPEGYYNVHSNRSSSVGTLQPAKQISESKAASPFLGESADARRPEEIDKTLADIRREEAEHDKLQAMHTPDEDHEYSEEESDEEIEDGDSGISEERNPEDFADRDLHPVVPGKQHGPPETVSIIERVFNNKKSFSCPRIKQEFVTGRSVGDLTPEDFGIIAAMGDSLATGTGLWPQTGIEFRGAAFPIGGDATIDGLVTIPNIMREFHAQELVGVSHGMGTSEQLPIHQLNVAEEGATSATMPQQAKELVRRMRLLKEVDVWNTWTMVIITIGTEEICGGCKAPDYDALVEALDILNRGIHKAFVVLLGPIHVSSAYRLKANLLQNRCACSKEEKIEFMDALSDSWTEAFENLQEHVNSVKRKTFGMLAIPMLTVTSRYPYSLFIPNRPLLNRRGHSYAAKWLWNRLIAGEKYNLSSAILSEDAYYCPGMGCPYFRTQENRHYCKILRHVDVEDVAELEDNENAKKPRRSKRHLYTTACVIFFVAFCTVSTLGTIFYWKSKKGSKGRFDEPPEAISKHEPSHTIAQTVEEELLIPPKLMQQNSAQRKSSIAN